ncbi:MAG: protein kinase [Planctomycetia bacterium]|nr:protein kinase [Planctomycetia bacterium]
MPNDALISVLSQLSDDVRDALTDWLADWDLSWQPGQIERQLDSLPSDLRAFRRAAIAELVKIDIVKMWRREMETLLESYLERFPELGTADTVTPDLIIAELEARKLAGKPASGREMTARFPQQIAAVRKLVSGSSLVAVSGVQPSSLPKAQQRTASVGPAETQRPSEKREGEAPAEPRTAARGAITPGASFGKAGRYRIVKELGGGGMGAVYLATDTQLGDRKVAIKVPHFSPTDSEAMLDRFKREAALLAAISHQNLGIVFDVNEHDGVHYLVMEFIDGTSLGAYLKTHTLLPQQSVSIVRKVATANACIPCECRLIEKTQYNLM